MAHACVHSVKRTVCIATAILLSVTICPAANQQPREDILALAPMESKSLVVPRLRSAPAMADLEGMEAHGNAREMAMVSNFIQSDPSDGQKATQRTEVYLG